MHLRFVTPHTVRLALLAATSVLVTATLAGCGIGTASTSVTPTLVNTVIEGKLMGGEQPISGAVVTLWETGITGYGTGAVQLEPSSGTVTTANGSGSFSFPVTNTPANCTAAGAGNYAYLVAQGGDPTGATQTNVNPAITLVAALNLCASIGTTQTFIVINELTTVAAAYALGNFASDSTTSTITGTVPNATVVVTTGTVKIGASSTNQTGLADAMANALTLVSSTYGVPQASTSSVYLPTTMINTLGNVLEACVNTTGPSVSNCENLMLYATPPATTTTPSDTFQAMMNIARYPGNQVANLMNSQVSTGFNFSPHLQYGSGNSVQNDLTLGVAFLNSTLAAAAVAPATITIDNADDVWTLGAANATSNYVTETTSASSGYSTTNTLGNTALAASHNVRAAEFDVASPANLWLSDGSTGGILELPAGSASAATAYTYTLTDGVGASLDANTYALAIDGSNNVFTASYGAQGNCIGSTNTSGTTVCEYVEFPASSYSTPTNLFSGNQEVTPSVRGMFADANTNATYSTYKGNVWSADYGITNATSGATAVGGSTVEILTPSTGALITVTIPGSAPSPYAVALDNTSSGWITNTTGNTLYLVPQNATNSTTPTAATLSSPSHVSTVASSPASTSSTTYAVGGLSKPKFDVIDGGGNVWVANSGSGALVEYSPAYNSSAGAYLSPYYGFSPSLNIPSGTAVSISKSKVTANVATFTTAAAPTFVPGQLVTLAGLKTLTNGTYVVTATTATTFTASTSTTTEASTTETATATPSASSQAPFYCSTAATTVCGVVNGQIYSPSPVAIDRAGSVWTMTPSGTLVEIIGTGVPTNPVTAAGQYGVKP